MRIGIIGAGNVGMALGRAWAAKGHDVTWGVRDPSQREGSGFATVADATQNTEIVLLAVMFHQVDDALAACGDLAGRILIDPTNPLAPADGGFELALGFDRSAAEHIAERTAARVVKSLNQVGAAVLGDTSHYLCPPLQFVASDHADAKVVVSGLVEELGFEVRDAGPLKAARLLEPMAMLWIDQAMRHGMEPDRAWSLSRRSEPMPE